MSKNKGFINAVNKEKNKEFMERENERRLSLNIMIQQTMDKVVIALGRMGFTPEQFSDFYGEYMKSNDDFIEDVMKDTSTGGFNNGDRSMTWFKHNIDRVIKGYVGEQNFLSYDERYASSCVPLVDALLTVLYVSHKKSITFKDIQDILMSLNLKPCEAMSSADMSACESAYNRGYEDARKIYERT